MKLKKLILTLGYALLLICPLASNAQKQGQEEDVLGENVGMEWSFHLGRLLPNQITGIEEILPMWGGRFGLKTGRGFVEMGAAFANALNTRITTLSLSHRGHMPVQNLVGHVYYGVDLHHIKAPGSENATILGGGHVGGGILALISNEVWLRGDMKFNVNPGTSLYVGFGIMLRFGDGK